MQIRPKGWRAVIDTNLNGTWWTDEAAGRHMLKARRGRVINIVANMWRGFPGMAHTGAARAAVVNLTRTRWPWSGRAPGSWSTPSPRASSAERA
ncbi:MAG: SDR family NAD(P)-dependent oxidoreductase [bacterium]